MDNNNENEHKNEKVDVSIHSKRLELASDLGVEHILTICEIVNEKIEQLSSNKSLNTNEKLYLFSAISICDELLRDRNATLDLHKDYSETTKRAGLENKQLQDDCRVLKNNNIRLVDEVKQLKDSIKDKIAIIDSLEKQYNGIASKGDLLEVKLEDKDILIRKLQSEIEALKEKNIEGVVEKENKTFDKEKEELLNKIDEQDKYILELQVSIQNQEDTILELLYEKEALAAQLKDEK